MNFLDPRSMVRVEQILAILDYMKHNPQLAHSRFSRTKEGRSLMNRHWSECADLANNVSSDCAQKTPDQWRLYYSAYKCKVKKKINDMKAALETTGGAPAKNRLSDLENRLYLILGPDLGELLPRVCNTPDSLQRIETEHQPSSSTADILLQDNSNFTIGSDSSDVEFYYPEEHTEHLAADPLQHIETEQQPSSSTADVLLQDNTNVTIGSDSSDVEFYYPEEHTEHLAADPVGNMAQLAGDSLVHTNQWLKLVVHTDQQLEPVVETDQWLEHEAHTDKRGLDRLVHTVQQPEHMVHIGEQPERLVHIDQQPERMVHIGKQPERLVHIDQQPERVVHIGQQPERLVQIDQQPEHKVRSGQIKKETVEGSPRRLRRRAGSEQEGDPANRETTEALLNVERMKIEAKQHATAALHRLAGALETIAERLMGPVSLQVTSPPRTRRRYARISSSESD